MVSQIYLAVLAVIALIICSAGYSFYVTYDNNTIARKFFVIAVAYVVCVVITLTTEFVPDGMLKQSLFYFAYFTKYMVLVTMLEIFGYLTGFFDANRHYVILTTTLFTNVGVGIFIINLFLGGTKLVKNDFGIFFDYNNVFYIVTNAVYFTLYIICIMYYLIRFKEKCVKPNDIFLYKNYLIIAYIIGIAMFIEISIGAIFKSYVPVILIAESICIVGIKHIISIRRTLLYIESDYEEFLKPSGSAVRFVCDADGVIIYQNKRAFIAGITHGDKFVGRKLNNVFMLSDENEAFTDESVTDVCECDAIYNENEHYNIQFEHHLDRFGRIFATLVSVYKCVDENAVELTDNITVDENAQAKAKNFIYVLPDELKEIRTKEYIKMADKFSTFYQGQEKELFYYNLKGAAKLATGLVLTSAEELIGRIESEYLFGSYESIEQLLTEFNRYTATLKALYF